MLVQLLELFNGFRMPPTPIDEFEQKGKGVLAYKMETFVRELKPIEFVMLGYPMKSSNDRDKVIGKLPDLAEEVSLKNFQRFNEMIKQVYSPGIKINIVNDGFVFNDLLGVEDNTVHAYQEMAMDMGKDAPMNWLNINDFFKSGSLGTKREKLMEQFGISNEELERRILLDPDVNFLYRGMIRFMQEELAVKDFPSGNQLHKAAKILTRNMMQRNEAYSNLVKDEFKSQIRLSMHPSVNNGAKFSFQLIPSERAWTSPWHCALAIDNDGVYETIHRKDAEAKGYQLIFKEGRPYHYIQPQ